MSSIQDATYNNQRQNRIATEQETNQVTHGGHKNVHGAESAQPVQGDGTDSFASHVQGTGQQTPRLSHAAPVPAEQTRDAANDNGQAAGNAMGSLSNTGNMGAMSMEAQEMDVGYHKDQRKTSAEDDTVESKNRAAQDANERSKAKKAAEAMRHIGEAAAIAMCPLVGIIVTAVIESKAKDKNNPDSQNGGDSQSEQAKKNNQNAWQTPIPGQNQGGQGQVQTTTGPDGQPVVQRGAQSQPVHGASKSLRPAPHSHQEQSLFNQGAQALAQAHNTLSAMPQSRKAGQFG